MDEKSECMFCSGHGVIEEWNFNMHDWEDIICPECGGTGVDDDPEGL